MKFVCILRIFECTHTNFLLRQVYTFKKHNLYLIVTHSDKTLKNNCEDISTLSYDYLRISQAFYTTRSVNCKQNSITCKDKEREKYFVPEGK